MNLWQFIEQGGVIMYILLLLNVIGLALLVWKIILLFGFKKMIVSHAKNVAQRFHHHRLKPEGEFPLELLKDEVSDRVNSLDQGMITIKIIATIAPLLGLLGTVLGILAAFTVISEKGLDDPTLFAKGISMALVTTVGGLIVAIPHYVGYNYLINGLNKLEDRLEKLTISFLFENERK